MGGERFNRKIEETGGQTDTQGGISGISYYVMFDYFPETMTMKGIIDFVTLRRKTRKEP
ncbi:hypothetical protein CHS0354_038708, partial [Potamilus streckersoni]